jgi:adenosylhomocysteine nucleosidase
MGTLGAATAEEIFAKNDSLTIGIISAVPGESGKILELMEAPTSYEKGRRIYYRGKLCGIDTVLVSSRVGKVAAAATATHLILEYNVNLILFTGVAGAIDPSLNIGDIVIANALIQHDMDARPFCPMYEIPLLKIKECHPDPLLESLALQASQHFVNKEIMEVIPQAVLREFNIKQPTVKVGLVVTGDQVFSQDTQKAKLRELLPFALCVEMEGASVSQVCYEYGGTPIGISSHENSAKMITIFNTKRLSYCP